jgi:hypothetical protein
MVQKSTFVLMGIQEIIMIILFAVALFYIGRTFYRSLNPKKGCASGCGKCGADFSKINIPDQKN